MNESYPTLANGGIVYDSDFNGDAIPVEKLFDPVNRTVVSSGQILTIESKTLTGIDILAGGSVYVGGSGLALDVNVFSGGSLIAYYGTASGVYVHEGAILESGGNFKDVTFAPGANCGASEGAGFANTDDKDSPVITRVSTYQGSGVGYIYSQTAVDLHCHGNLDITEGGVVSGGVFGQGSTWVSSGAFVDSVSLTSGAYFEICHSGVANKLTIGDGALVYVGGSGVASNTEVLAGGTLVAYYGTADGIYVHAGAILESGDKFQNVTFAAGANCGAAEGAGFANTGDKDSPIITRISAYAGSGVGYIYGQTAADLHCKGNLNVGEAGVVSGGEFSLGSTWVYSGGFVESVSLIGGAYVDISNAGSANKLTIGEGALVYVGGSGVASNTEVLSGGSLTAYYGTAEGVYVHAGAILESGDKFQNVIFEAGADCGHAEGAGFGNISDKDSPIITRVSTYAGVGKGYIYGQTAEDLHCKGDLDIYGGGVVSRGEFIQGSVSVGSGGYAAGVSVHNGGSVVVDNSGFIEGFNVEEGGAVVVGGSGVASNTEVLAGGTLVAYYGTADGVYVHAGAILESGDKFQNVIFEAGANCGAAEGAGFANTGDKDSPIITKISAYAGSGVGYIYGQTAADLHCKGNLNVFEGGVVSGGVFGQGSTWVYSGGFVESVSLISGANVDISNTGSANKLTIGDGAKVYVGGSGVATDVEVLAGGTLVAYYGTADGVYVHAGAILESGDKFQNVTFAAGANCGAAEGAGFVNLGDTDQTLTRVSAYAGNGVGYLYGQTMSGLYAGGVLSAYDGGIIDGGHLAAGAFWAISSGATVKNVLVDEGAEVDINYAARLEGSYNVNGSMWVASGAEVAIWNPSTVGATGKLTMSGTWNFVVASATAGNAALVENYATANGGKYSITVSDLQKRGDYKLIGNASAFNSSVTITVAETGASDIFVWTKNNNSIGGSYNKVVFGDRKYTLAVDGSKALTLTVVAPPVITLEGDNTTPLQSSTLTAVTDDGSAILYSLDNTTWNEYTAPLQITANGTYYFKSTNSEGLVGTAEYTFANIDRIPPVITVTGDNTTPLQASTVSATVDDGSAIFYSTDTAAWTEYTGEIAVTANATYYFKATDAAGNVGTAELVFANIDTTAPVITLTGDNVTPMQVSLVSAVTDDGSAILYSLDNTSWNEYTDPIEVTANATYYFKSTDAAGNVGTAEIVFANIDTTAPVITVSGDNKTWLKSSTLTAVTDDGSAISYSTDNATWFDYEDAITVTANATYYLMAVDAAGNVGTAEYVFANIDTTAPVAPSALAATVVDQTVTLSWTASTDDLSGVKEYVVTCSHDGKEFSSTTATASFVIEKADAATWSWSVKAVDAAGNASVVSIGEDFVVDGSTPGKTFVPGSDIDGNGVSDVLFHWTGGDYQVGFWMNGTSEWQGQGRARASEWVILGSYDMNSDGKADMLMAGKDSFLDMTGTYIGYYDGSVDVDANWHTVGFLVNMNDWKNAVGNLTGNEGKNSIVWYAPELYSLGAWSDGTESWTAISSQFGGDDWAMIGCGDFDGDGKDSVVMSYNGGVKYYSVGLDGVASELADSDNGWEVRAIGDFSGDGKDDIVAFHKETGLVAMWGDGNSANWSQLGQLDAKDWFVVGAGDYNGDQKDDLLVRQYSTGMLGYYTSGDMAQWNELGRGVDMNWTVIA